MDDDKLYAFVLRGELTKVALGKTEVVNKHSSSDALVQEYIETLSLDLLDDECINASKPMATVCTAISAFDWARQIIQTRERSRNVIMYSGELERKDVERVGTNIRDWISQVGG